MNFPIHLPAYIKLAILLVIRAHTVVAHPRFQGTTHYATQCHSMEIYIGLPTQTLVSLRSNINKHLAYRENTVANYTVNMYYLIAQMWNVSDDSSYVMHILQHCIV